MQSVRRLFSVVLAIAVCASATAAQNPATLLDRLGEKKVSTAERKKISAALIEIGDEAVAPIMEKYNHRRTIDGCRTVLVDTLGGIGSPDAVKALRGIAAATILLPMDITDWPGLVSTLAAAATGTTATPTGRIWMLIPHKTRELISAAGAEEAQDAKFKAKVVAGLNQVMETWNLYDAQTFAGVSLPNETAEYISRWKPKRPKQLIPSVDISPFELKRLNRLLVQASLANHITEPPPFDIVTYRGHLAGQALKALTSINTPEATEVVVSFRPHTGKVEHIEALSKLKDDRALQQLIEYLLSDELSASTRAKGALKARFSAIPGGAESTLKIVIARISMRGATFAPHVAENLAGLCATLDDRAAARLLAECVESQANNVASAGLDALALRLDLVTRNEVIAAMFAVTERAIVAEIALKVLELLRDARAERGVDIAAAMLEHESLRVQSMAASTLRALTGRKLGAPVEWRTAIRTKPAFLLPEDERPGTRRATAVTAVPGGNRTSYAVFYYIILGSLLVAVLVVGATRKRMRVAKKQLDKTKRKRAREENYVALD